MPTYKVTEWDSGPEDGSLSFELLEDGRITSYVISYRDNTYRHLSNNFTDITETISERIASLKEITVASYIATNRIKR